MSWPKSKFPCSIILTLCMSTSDTIWGMRLCEIGENKKNYCNIDVNGFLIIVTDSFLCYMFPCPLCTLIAFMDLWVLQGILFTEVVVSFADYMLSYCWAAVVQLTVWWLILKPHGDLNDRSLPLDGLWTLLNNCVTPEYIPMLLVLELSDKEPHW